MSFDMNISTRNLSSVQASSKTTDGGAGNTGYYSRDGGSKDEDVGLKFANSYELDTFEKNSPPITLPDEKTLLDLIIAFLKRFFEKIKALFIK